MFVADRCAGGKPAAGPFSEAGYSNAVCCPVRTPNGSGSLETGVPKIMSITVRFFASIREKLGKEQDIIESKGITCVADVWSRSARVPMPDNTLVAVNMEYARPDQPVHDGDEVAFFPPVTGGAQ